MQTLKRTAVLETLLTRKISPFVSTRLNFYGNFAFPRDIKLYAPFSRKSVFLKVLLRKKKNIYVYIVSIEVR